MTQTYELANNPYYRQPENVTIVTIKKEHGQRYSYEQAGLTKQTATDEAVKHNQEETDRYGKIIHAVVLNAVAGKTIAYGTNYKELVELIPLAEVGKHYMAHDLITIEDPNHTELDGEGKRVLVQLNREFTYNGEPVSDFARNGRLELDETGAAWKFEPKE